MANARVASGSFAEQIRPKAMGLDAPELFTWIEAPREEQFKLAASQMKLYKNTRKGEKISG